MKDTFPEYYVLTDKEFDEIWKKCLFALDANVLLNLYRYTEESKDELIKIFNRISNRLWVPHQAALEYQQNRLQTIRDQLDICNKVKDILDDELKELKNKLDPYKKHPFINTKSVHKELNKVFNAIIQKMNVRKEKQPDLFHEDKIRDTITKLLKGKVGSPYSEDKLKEIYKIGEYRYGNDIPPGYKDSNKQGNNKYGDLIIWFQIIEKARETKKPIILITDELKEDWWWRIKGETISPRPELIKEILSEAGVLFYMYNADRFMEYAQEYLKQRVKKKAIDEVYEFRKLNEEFLKNLNNITKSLQEIKLKSFLDPIHLEEMEKQLELLSRSYQPIYFPFPDSIKNLQHQLQILSENYIKKLYQPKLFEDLKRRQAELLEPFYKSRGLEEKKEDFDKEREKREKKDSNKNTNNLLE